MTGAEQDIENAKKMIEDIIAGVQRVGGSQHHMGFQNAPGAMSVLIPVPNDHVGLIIGKGGETIKNIQMRTGAKFSIAKDQEVDPVTNTRSFVAIGNQQMIAGVQQMVAEILMQQQQNQFNKMQAHNPAGMLPPNVLQQQGVASGNIVTETVVVSGAKVGLVIGKGGDTIKNIQVDCAVTMKVDPVAEPNGDRRVIISGPVENVTKAKEVVFERAYSQPKRGGPRGRKEEENLVFKMPDFEYVYNFKELEYDKTTFFDSQAYAAAATASASIPYLPPQPPDELVAMLNQKTVVPLNQYYDAMAQPPPIQPAGHFQQQMLPPDDAIPGFYPPPIIQQQQMQQQVFNEHYAPVSGARQPSPVKREYSPVKHETSPGVIQDAPVEQKTKSPEPVRKSPVRPESPEATRIKSQSPSMRPISPIVSQTRSESPQPSPPKTRQPSVSPRKRTSDAETVQVKQDDLLEPMKVVSRSPARPATKSPEAAARRSQEPQAKQETPEPLSKSPIRSERGKTVTPEPEDVGDEEKQEAVTGRSRRARGTQKSGKTETSGTDEAEETDEGAEKKKRTRGAKKGGAKSMAPVEEEEVNEAETPRKSTRRSTRKK